MALHSCTCLIAFLLVPGCLAAGVKAKVKAKAKDPWDVPDGGSEGLEASPAAAMEDDMSPQEQAGIMQQVAARREARRGHNQHAVMKQFMSTFANNMRLSVLSDSKGDMPEEERQRLIAKAEAAKQASDGSGDSRQPEEEVDASAEMAEPPPRRMSPRRHMLNMAEARHRQKPRHASHRLLPEAEGIGFPAPEGMASDPATEGMSNDPGSTSFGSETAEQEEAPLPPPRPRKHYIHMLNSRESKKRYHHSHQTQPAGVQSGRPQLPSGLVRDEMGRAMPLLFTDTKPTQSGAFSLALAPLAAFGIACLLCF